MGGDGAVDASETRWGAADLHVHTCHDGWGDGNDGVEAIFAHVEERTDLDVLGIADHDSTEAARAARELFRERSYRFDFLPGVEVTTTSGHLLCYFPDEIFDVPSLRPLAWTARLVRERGGLCVLAHPVYPPWLRRSAMDPSSRILQSVDGVEVVNGGVSVAAQERLDRIAEALGANAALLGNSDSHHKDSIGSAFTAFPGRSRVDLIDAIRARRTRPVASARVNMPRPARSFTRRRSMTRPGWVRNVYREVAGRHR